MNTAVYNVRLELKCLAIIHKHFEGLGIPIKSISALTRQVLEAYSESLVIQKGSYEFTTTAESVKYFTDRDMMGPLEARGKSAIVKGIQKDAMIADGIDPSYMERKSKANVNPDQYAAARLALGIIIDEADKEANAILGLDPGTVKGEQQDKDEP